MPLSPPNEEDAQEEGTGQTLADLLLRLSAPAQRRELEEFRIKFEAEFGETDLTRNYTSTWPTERQVWLIEHHPRRYWDGLPGFVQAYLKDKMRSAHRCGKLDDTPDHFLRLYLTGEMTVRSDDRSR
jgi:hypothetical protein